MTPEEREEAGMEAERLFHMALPEPTRSIVGVMIHHRKKSPEMAHETVAASWLVAVSTFMVDGPNDISGDFLNILLSEQDYFLEAPSRMMQVFLQARSMYWQALESTRRTKQWDEGKE